MAQTHRPYSYNQSACTLGQQATQGYMVYGRRFTIMNSLLILAIAITLGPEVDISSFILDIDSERLNYEPSITLYIKTSHLQFVLSILNS